MKFKFLFNPAVRTLLRTHTKVREGMSIRRRNQAIQRRVALVTNKELSNFVV